MCHLAAPTDVDQAGEITVGVSARGGLPRLAGLGRRRSVGITACTSCCDEHKSKCAGVGEEGVEDQQMTGEQALASSTQLSGGVIDGRYVDAPFPYAS